MADSNNYLAGRMPPMPNPALRTLDRLIGTWKQTGGYNGTATYEWMEGGFFFIQHFDGITPYERHVKGVEYVGFDEDTQTLRSHLMGIDGSNFTYTWQIEGDTLTIWFGDNGSDNFFRGTFSKDGNTITGRWQWPDGEGKVGGYQAILTRVGEGR